MNQELIECLEQSDYSWIQNFTGTSIEIIQKIYEQTVEPDGSYHTSTTCGLARAFIKMNKDEELDYYSKQLLMGRGGILGVLAPVYKMVISDGQKKLVQTSPTIILSFLDIIEWKFGVNVCNEFYKYVNE